MQCLMQIMQIADQTQAVMPGSACKCMSLVQA